MGMRFRKSVKICKGVKINFSKSGSSLSLGGRGHSVNIGSRGVRQTVGIPGTGVSYSSNIVGGSQKRSTGSSSRSGLSRRSSSRTNVSMPGEIEIHMDDRGEVSIKDKNGITITDQSVLRRIKSTDQYKNMINQLQQQRADKIDEIVWNAEEENERFINIHKLAPVVDSNYDFLQRLASLKPQVYVSNAYSNPVPTEDDVRAELEKEAKENIHASFFKLAKMRKQYVEERLEERLSLAKHRWEQEASRYYENQMQERRSATAHYLAEYEYQKRFLAALINGEENAIGEVFDSWISSCELPVEMSVNYDWNSNLRVMMIDVDLPEIEDLSATIMTKTSSGNLKEKKKTQTELRVEYATLVFGLAIFISSNAFNISPAVSKIVLSGYTQRRNKNGDISDDYIISLKFPRELFEKRNMSLISPKDFCLSVENRCNMTSTSMFKTIKPYEAYY